MAKNKPIFCIFPHNEKKGQVKRFRKGVDGLRVWLIDYEDGLKSDGVYYVRCHEPTKGRGKRRPQLLPFPLPPHISPSSVVLFRFKGETVGDAVVKKVERTSETERKKLGRDWTVRAEFYPKTIRIFPNGSVTDKDLEKILNEKEINRRRYVVLQHEQYKQILEKVCESFKQSRTKN